VKSCAIIDVRDRDHELVTAGAVHRASPLLGRVERMVDQLLMLRREGEPSSLTAALDLVDESVQVVVLSDLAALEDTGARFLQELLAALSDADDVDAATRARPVTDAVKRVDGDRVIASVDRSTLAVPRLPQAARADALRARRDLLAGVDGLDVCGVLVSAGRRVRLVADGPTDECRVDRASQRGR
jgi:2-C-methyl-D-erythritol 4-phosphate cytidylyltransferase